MRSVGSRRGNPLLRTSIEQSSRRRLESWIVPHASSAPALPGDDEAPEYSREFFERIRRHWLPRMTRALAFEGVEVLWCGATEPGLWAMSSNQGLVLAYECADTPALLAERAKRWLGCLRTRTMPGILSRTWGAPVYGARLDTVRDELDILWARPGAWRGTLLADEPDAGGWSLPPHWRPAGLAGA
jgi:hypothetical protein